MVYHTIAVGVSIVSRKIVKSNHPQLVGSQQATRKKPHVIDVALKQSIQHNCWCITLMAIYTTPI
jgi:hypothetical protein